MTARRKPRGHATSTLAERQARGTSRPVAFSLDAAWLARLDALRRAEEGRSAVLRRAVVALERAT